MLHPTPYHRVAIFMAQFLFLQQKEANNSPHSLNWEWSSLYVSGSTTTQHSRVQRAYQLLFFHVHLFWPQLAPLLLCVHLCLGFMAMLRALPMKTNMPTDPDLIFTSASATTMSSMQAVVEMESFNLGAPPPEPLLMLLGGEVFTTFLRMYFTQRPRKKHKHHMMMVPK
ncbi:hypothetical protein ZWY2020_010486 [Hordeum vulgare]|nr:hypothetical protein ZWY2020_010486 [Hordeum vulgare]